MIRMDIDTIFVGSADVASMVVLRPRDTSAFYSSRRLPIRIGLTEAVALQRAFDAEEPVRPRTHDLMVDLIGTLGATLLQVCISRVVGTTFYADLVLLAADGTRYNLDARPSDAIALAARAKAPIFVEESVLTTANYPDFQAVRKDEINRELGDFHEFVEGLSPEDFFVDRKNDKNE